MHNFYRRLRVGSVAGLLALASLVPSGWAQASEPQSERLAYALMIGGLRVGDAVVNLSQDPDSYSTSLKLNTRGVAKWLRDFSADMSGQGAFTSQQNVAFPLPTSFRRAWSGAEIDSTMIMSYDPATRLTTTQERFVSRETGEEVKREDLPWNRDDKDRDRPNRRKPVSDEMKASAIDPMAAFIAARHQVMAQGGAKAPIKFRVPVYDGQRRYDVVGTTMAPRQTTINGTTHNVITVNATVVPIAGFSPRGEERMHESRGKLLFTADERFIPVQVMIENEFMTGVMNFTGDCKVTPEACDAPVQAAAN